MDTQAQRAWVTVAVARPEAGDGWVWSVPVSLRDVVAIGQSVIVPIGPVLESGWIVAFPDAPEVDEARVRPLVRVADPTPAFDEHQLGFFRWIADYYLASLGMVLRTAIPGEARVKVTRVLVPTEQGVDALALREPEGLAGTVLRDVISRPGLTRRGLARRLSQEDDEEAVSRAVDRVVRRGWARWEDRADAGPRAMVPTLALGAPVDGRKRLGPRQRGVLAFVSAAAGPVDLAALLAAQGEAARDSVRTLVRAGHLVAGEREGRDALVDAAPLGAAVAPPLHPDQVAALSAISAPGARGAFLLFGVTGSGKTEVFLGAAQAVLARGGQVCVLVPEIGLTPQLVGRFRARFGDDVAVLHSGLTGAERLAHWRRVRSGEARVVVGARSALFAPFRQLGLIVVDEEHDDSYKQDDGVRYHARDLAVVLGKRAGAPVVLASATPSLESWTNAAEGRYALLRLPRRATPRPVPAVELVDMTEIPRPKEGPRPLFAPACVDALAETFARGGQAIVLYNRRGFATQVACGDCGGAWECPSCGIAMTLHRAAGVLACHYCGLRRPWQETCPSCGAGAMEELGKGTERVEEELKSLFPDVPVARMDADTTAVRGSLHALLDDFRQGRTRLLVGTQILAKGHDFPGVHTAVVVSVDQGFRMPDFRASERTFSLLVQLAGRAGRGEVAGRVLVQTWKPDHYALTLAGDVEGFLTRELRLRRTLQYPPFSRLVLVRLDGEDRAVVQEAARALAGALRRGLPEGIDVLGPALAALPRLVGRWRVQVLVRGRDARALRGWLRGAQGLILSAARRGVRVIVDVDPRNLM
jgi:primosomal protein N' (replication factor Y)